MGIDFRIGTIEPTLEDSSYEYEVYARVPDAFHHNSPTYANGFGEDHKNSLGMTYEGFESFLEEVGALEEFERARGLVNSHPGYIRITARLIQLIANVRFRWQFQHYRAPSYTKYIHNSDPEGGAAIALDQSKYDYSLAYLLWFEGWMNWAYRNYERPCCGIS